MKVSGYVNLFEMARADLEGVAEVIKSGDFDKAATMYISKAKARGLDAKKVIIGLGSTFRTYTDIGADEIKQLKDAIKEKLSGELPEKKEKKNTKEEKKESTPGERKERQAEITKSVAKKKSSKKTELIKAPKEPKEETPMGESVMRRTLRREILERAGLREMHGDEGDQQHAFGSKKGSSKSSMSSGGGGGNRGEVAKAKGKAQKKAENEEKAGEDREGTRGAPGLGPTGKYILGASGGVSGGGSKYLGGSKGSVAGGGSKYAGGSRGSV